MKDKNDLPEELVFRINYLGGEMTNYSLNFSKSSSTIIAQYYNFIRLGRSGYTDNDEHDEQQPLPRRKVG